MDQTLNLRITEIMEQINELESILLNGLIQKYPSLKSHIPYLVITERKSTGAGLLVNFDYSSSAKELKFDDINALFSGEENIEIKGLKHGLGYVIDITDGQILYIEFTTYGENWNGKIGDFKIVKE